MPDSVLPSVPTCHVIDKWYVSLQGDHLSAEVHPKFLYFCLCRLLLHFWAFQAISHTWFWVSPLCFSTLQLWSAVIELAWNHSSPDLGMCTFSVLKKDTEFQKLLQSHLDSWFKFVPRAEDMLPEYRNPCWYSNISLPLAWQKNVDTWPEIPGNITFRVSSDNLTSIVSNALASQSLPALNHSLYCLHGLLEIGFPKCGSTSLYNMIAAHDDVASLQVKEGQFWQLYSHLNNTLVQDLHVILYANHFQKAAAKISTNTRAITHDGSAWTVYGIPPSARRFTNHVCLLPVLLSRVLPKTKLIVVMRNPVHRVWSHFWWDCGNAFPGRKQEFVQHGATLFHNFTVSVIDNFKQCIESGTPEFSCVDRTIHHYRNRPEDYCRRVQVGVSMYYIHLVKWFSVFDRDQIFVLRTEDIATDQLPTIKLVWIFLDLRDPFVHETRRIEMSTYYYMNPLAHSAEGSQENRMTMHPSISMLPETYTLLDNLFRPYNERLAALLNDQRFLWQ